MTQAEFSLPGAYHYTRSSPGGWLRAHLGRFRVYLLIYLCGTLAWHILTAAVPQLIGRGFDALLQATPDQRTFGLLVAALLLVILARGLCGIGASFSLEKIANGIERNIREELAANLLGKSQTFFERRRVGDIMARATDDTGQVNELFAPGLNMLLETVFGLVVPIVFVAFIHPALLLAPLIFGLFFLLSLWEYGRRLAPVAGAMREQFGLMNAELAEAVAGIELIEASNQKPRERDRFEQNARHYRDLFVRQSRLQALYLPPLLLVFVMVGALAHGLALLSRGTISVGDLVAYLGLIGVLRAPTALMGLSLGLLVMGFAGARRILELLNDTSSLDENAGGHRAPICGAVALEGVSFSYSRSGAAQIHDISFQARPGTTVALVGATGAGKTTLARLLNRSYDPDCGAIRIDGVDLREWSLESLRSQIAVIEQDVRLFARSVAENIAFGASAGVSRAQIEQAARAAQAHGFISALPDGYDTIIGERGVTLSGGQRQRLAIARALLTDPRILIIDDSTSAVDSTTEADIQAALRNVAAQRTTLLITHRLAQIRQADLIVVLEQGRVVDQGSHDLLIQRCPAYQRMFAPYYAVERA